MSGILIATANHLFWMTEHQMYRTYVFSLVELKSLYIERAPPTGCLMYTSKLTRKVVSKAVLLYYQATVSFPLQSLTFTAKLEIQRTESLCSRGFTRRSADTQQVCHVTGNHAACSRTQTLNQQQLQSSNHNLLLGVTPLCLLWFVLSRLNF